VESANDSRVGLWSKFRWATVLPSLWLDRQISSYASIYVITVTVTIIISLDDRAEVPPKELPADSSA
jgi:hypothetical protein